MRGVVINLSDDLLPDDSPWRTHETLRRQRPIFHLPDGRAVFEAWVWYEPLERWLCMSNAFDFGAVRAGVVYYATMPQLKAQLCVLEGARAA